MSKITLPSNNAIIIDGQDQFNDTVIELLSYLAYSIQDNDMKIIYDTKLKELDKLKDAIIKSKNK